MIWLNKYFIFGTLRGRLMLSVAIIHAVMMTAFIIDLTFRQKSMLLARQEEMAITYCQTLSTSASVWLAANDVSGLQELIVSQQRNTEIIYSMIVDKRGNVLAHTSKINIGKFTNDLPGQAKLTIISKSPELIDITVPVMLAGRHLGWARIGLGQQLANKKLTEVIYSGIFYVIASILIGAFVAWFMGRNISNRLYVIQNTIKKVSAGNSEARSHLSGNDEASVLAQEFNIMLDTLSRTEKELQEHLKDLKDYKFALDESSITAIADEKGVIQAVNSNFCKISKYSKDELIDNFHKLINSNYYSKEFGTDFWNTISSGKVWKGELVNTAKDGQYYWVYANIIPFLDAQKKPFQYLIICFDITEKKISEEKFREKSTQLEMLGNNLHDTIMYQMVREPDGKIYFVYLSKSTESLIGKTSDEIIQNSAARLDIIYEEDKKIVVAAEEISFRNMSEFNLEVRIRHSSGNLKWVHIRSVPRKLVGGRVIWDGIYTDITARKESEESIRESEAMLKTVFDNSPVGIAIFDKNAFLKKANKKINEIFGLQAESLIGSYNFKNDPSFQSGDILEKFNSGIDIYHEIKFNFNEVKYGSTKTDFAFLDIIVTPISDTLSKNIGYIIQVNDITDKKLIEQKIVKAIIQTQESERKEIGGELHDNVCQILVAVTMNLGILRKSLPSSATPVFNETKQFVNMALEDIRNMSHRIAPVFFKDMKIEEAFSRLLYTFHFDEEVKILLHIDVDAKKHRLNPELQLNLYRILQEQLRNIQKYSEAKYISINVSIEHPTLKMVITDNGIGFDSHKNMEGIGMANMKRRTEMFFGKFEIVSSPGNGCVLKIEFPI